MDRQHWAELYNRELADLGWLKTPCVPKNCGHAWQAYVCYVDESQAPKSRNQIMEKLQAQGISTRPGTHAVHLLSYYQNRFGFGAEDYPRARNCDRYTMAIPLHNRMTAEDYGYVIHHLKTI